MKQNIEKALLKINEKEDINIKSNDKGQTGENINLRYCK